MYLFGKTVVGWLLSVCINLSKSRQTSTPDTQGFLGKFLGTYPKSAAGCAAAQDRNWSHFGHLSWRHLWIAGLYELWRGWGLDHSISLGCNDHENRSEDIWGRNQHLSGPSSEICTSLLANLLILQNRASWKLPAGEGSGLMCALGHGMVSLWFTSVKQTLKKKGVAKRNVSMFPWFFSWFDSGISMSLLLLLTPGIAPTRMTLLSSF